MKIISHRFEKARTKYENDSWYAIVEHEGNNFEVMIRVIKGDYSEIVGCGNCTATPNK